MKQHLRLRRGASSSSYSRYLAEEEEEADKTCSGNALTEVKVKKSPIRLKVVHWMMCCQQGWACRRYTEMGKSPAAEPVAWARISFPLWG